MKRMVATWTLMASVIAMGAAVALAQTDPAKASPSPSSTDKVRINGWALNMSNVATGANQTIQITINNWSSPSQRALLIDTFMAKKQNGLLDALRKQPEMGRFNFPGYRGPDPDRIM